MRVKIKAAMLFMSVAVLTVPFASADTITTYTGNLGLASNLSSKATFTVNSTNNTFSLAFKITNASATNATINAFSLQLFSDAETVTTLTLPTGWQYFDNQKINNNGTTGCTGNSHPGWLCADDNLTATAAPATIGANGGTLTFSFGGTYLGTPVTPLDLMANGLTNSTDANSKWAVSAGMDTSSSTVPEPATLALLGTGMLGIGGSLRSRFSSVKK